MSAVVAALRRRFGERQLGLPVFILIIALGAGLIEPRFWSLDNVVNLARQMAPLMILVAGQVFAVISGGLDLSVASIMALAGVVGILAYGAAPSVALAIATMVMVGLAVGLLNGLIVVRFRVSPLIVTLGMLSMAKGLALLLTSGLPIYDVPDAMVDGIGFGTVLGVPAPALVALAALVVGAVILRTTVLGRHIYAVGSNRPAARNSGVDVGRTTVLVYVISGGMAGVAAVVLTSWVSAAQPLAGTGLELQSLAAVVVGGVALAGGSGTMLQAFYGAVILGMLSNAFNMAGVSSYLQTFAVGFVIVVAVVLDRLRREGTEST